MLVVIACQNSLFNYISIIVKMQYKDVVRTFLHRRQNSGSLTRSKNSALIEHRWPKFFTETKLKVVCSPRMTNFGYMSHSLNVGNFQKTFVRFSNFVRTFHWWFHKCFFSNFSENATEYSLLSDERIKQYLDIILEMQTLPNFLSSRRTGTL